MKSKTWLSLICGSVMAITGVAQAQPTVTVKKPTRDELYRTFEVAGIRLGMSLGAVQAVLAQRGYSIGRTSKMCGWECRLTNVARPNVDIETLRAATADRLETIEVIFDMSPGGQTVSEVRYKVSDTKISQEALQQQADARWGHLVKRVRQYCLKSEPDCGDASYRRHVFPTALLYFSQWHDITMFEGTYLSGLRISSFNAEVERRRAAGRTNVTTF